jgi:hypothetical protein
MDTAGISWPQILLLIFTGLTLFLILPLMWWNLNKNTDFGSPCDNCNDFNPCTPNLCLHDGTCVTPPRIYQNGTDCSAEDRCYQPVSQWMPSQPGDRKLCIDGTCTADYRHCKGYCQNDGDCQPLPLNNLSTEGVGIDTFCFAQSCVTLVVGGYTSECLSWIDTTPSSSTTDATENSYTAACLYTRFDDYGSAFPPGVCYFRYQCAPLNFGPIVPLTATATATTTTKTLAHQDHHHHKRSDDEVETAPPTHLSTVPPTRPGTGSRAPTAPPTHLSTVPPTRSATTTTTTKAPTSRSAAAVVPGTLGLQFASEPMTRAQYLATHARFTSAINSLAVKASALDVVSEEAVPVN